MQLKAHVANFGLHFYWLLP